MRGSAGVTSFPDDADFSKIMLLSLEKDEIDILHLPNQYERSEREKNKSLVLSAAAEAAQPRSCHALLHWRGKSSFFILNLLYLTEKPRPGPWPDGHSLELLRFTGQTQSHGRG